MLWYLVLPFTLLNAVAAMAPRRNPGLTRAQRILTWTFSLGLTVMVSVWSMAVAEQLATVLRLELLFGPEVAHVSAVLTATVGLVSAMAYRARRGADRADGWLMHAAVVLAVLGLALCLRPAQIDVDPVGGWGLVSTYGSSQTPSTSVAASTANHSAAFLDPVALVTLALLGAAVMAQVYGALLPKRSVIGDDVATPLRATVLTGLLSYVLATLFLGTLAVTLPGLLANALAGFVDAVPASADPDAAIIAPRLRPSYVTSILPLAMVTTLLVLVLVFMRVTGAVHQLRLRDRVRARLRRGTTAGPANVVTTRSPGFLDWAHRLVVDELPRTFSRLSLWAAVTLLAIVAAFLALVDDRASRDRPTGTITPAGGVIEAPPVEIYPVLYTGIDLLVAASLAVSLYLLRSASSWAPLRATLAGVADVAGFWPRSVAPLGARCYRQGVCTSLARAVREAGEPVVVVGHSQGSVIAAWLVAHRDEFEIDRPRGLVTCGSPLEPLYARLFPRFFGEPLYAKIAADCVSWRNVWRETDPIAGPIANPWVHNVLVDDGPDAVTGEWRGHAEYWVDPRQSSLIQELMRPRSGPSVDG